LLVCWQRRSLKCITLFDWCPSDTRRGPDGVEKGLKGRGRLVGSVSVKEEYPMMAEPFASQVMKGAANG
jgi:hypothetical protein